MLKASSTMATIVAALHPCFFIFIELLRLPVSTHCLASLHMYENSLMTVKKKDFGTRINLAENMN